MGEEIGSEMALRTFGHLVSCTFLWFSLSLVFLTTKFISENVMFHTHKKEVLLPRLALILVSLCFCEHYSRCRFCYILTV